MEINVFLILTDTKAAVESSSCSLVSLPWKYKVHCLHGIINNEKWQINNGNYLKTLSWKQKANKNKICFEKKIQEPEQKY